MKKSNNIQNNGFKTPDNYFENFNNDMQTRIIEEKLKDKFGNKNPFTIPENYFSNFSVEINENRKSTGKIFQLLKPWFSVAAGIIVIFGIWQILLTNIDTKGGITYQIDTIQKNNTVLLSDNSLNFENIDTNEINKEVENYIVETDLITLTNNSLNETENFELNTDEELIEEYLIDNFDDLDYDEILASL